MRVSTDYGWQWFGLGFSVGKLHAGKWTNVEERIGPPCYEPAVYLLELDFGPLRVSVTW